jgi:1-acyl-sn-glycerol-3-phosphate acyltransferase
MHSRDNDTLEEPDHDLIRACIPLLRVLEKLFRVEIYGLENMPKGKALVVGNHNAGLTFISPFFLGIEWYIATDGKDSLRPLGHDAMMNFPLLGHLLKAVGVIRASHHSAEKAFAAGKKVLVYPGGSYEAFRPFCDRNKVDFGGRTGYVKLALRHKVPIVPVMHLGDHETFIVLHRGQEIAEFIGLKKYLRSDACPIFFGMPWGLGFGPIFHLPLPSKFVIEIGKPISLARYRKKDITNPKVIREIDEKVQGRIQEMMDKRAKERKWPLLG